MQLRYIRPFSQYVPGDVVEVPDGAAFDNFYLERVPDPPADPPAPEPEAQAPDPAPADPPRLPYPAKEM